MGTVLPFVSPTRMKRLVELKLEIERQMFTEVAYDADKIWSGVPPSEAVIYESSVGWIMPDDCA